MTFRLGIAVIPESLIAVLTITMSAGTSRMAKQNVIVRRLNALEALGGVTDICSDKTGTLTQGKMVVRKVWIASGMLGGDEKVSGDNVKADDIIPGSRLFSVESGTEALRPEGRVLEMEGTKERVIDAGSIDDSLRAIVECASLCNMATISQNKEGVWKSMGDPTEVALQVLAHKMSLGRPTLARVQSENDDEPSTGSQRYKLLTEFPFDSELKRMSVVYSDRERPEQDLILLKGAVSAYGFCRCA